MMTIQDCMDQLRALGLKIHVMDPEWVLFWAIEIHRFNTPPSTDDRSCLVVDHENHRWVFVLWALTGNREYAIPGTLEELTPLILKVYTNYRDYGGTFLEAFRRAVPEHMKYFGDELYVGRHKYKDSPEYKRAREVQKAQENKKEEKTKGTENKEDRHD